MLYLIFPVLDVYIYYVSDMKKYVGFCFYIYSLPLAVSANGHFLGQRSG